MITCDVSEEFTAIARKHWARHPAGKKIDLASCTSDRNSGESLSPPFDLVFIDADKKNYPVYYEKALELLSPRRIDRSRQRAVGRARVGARRRRR